MEEKKDGENEKNSVNKANTFASINTGAVNSEKNSLVKDPFSWTRNGKEQIECSRQRV